MKNNITQLYFSVVKYGGGSYNFENNLLNPTTGYMVDIPGTSKYYPFPESPEAFREIVVDFVKDRHKEVFTSQTENFLGAWVNPDNGMICLDVSQRVPVKFAAIQVARERAQIAILDNANGEVISVKFAYMQRILNPTHVQSVTTI